MRVQYGGEVTTASIDEALNDRARASASDTELTVLCVEERASAAVLASAAHVATIARKARSKVSVRVSPRFSGVIHVGFEFPFIRANRLAARTRQRIKKAAKG